MEIFPIAGVLTMLTAGFASLNVKAAAKPVISSFRAMHSGYIGDYVTWFMIGAAIITAVSLAV